MTLKIEQEVAAMRQMALRQLQAKYVQLFGEPPRCCHKQHLLRRIAWRLQALAEGDLSQRARRRAAQLANHADLRLTAPPNPTTPLEAASRTTTQAVQFSADKRLPMPGTIITRQYKGQTLQVRVLPKGFEYQGEIYKSLSAVAKAVTGGQWNGYHFFGLGKKGASR